MLRATLSLIAMAAAAPAAAQIVGEAHPYTIGDVAFEGYVARNASLEPRGTVVIVHDWDGLGTYERQRADMVAALGFTAFAIDVYGVENRPQNAEENMARMDELFADRETFRARLLAGIEEGRRLGGEGGMVLMGYCFGGAAALEAARAGASIEGFVSFHGVLQTPEGQSYAAGTAPVLVLQGAADPLSGPEAVGALVGELEAAGVEHAAQIYGGVRHTFTVWGSPDYDLEADRASWQAFTAFLDARL
jgi:dienelactone hydrolase